jgi:hypothetical protein
METQEEEIKNEDLLWPPKVDMVYIWLISIWSAVSGFMGWLFILFITYIFLWKIPLTEWVFPYILSLVGFFSTIITNSFTLLFNKMIMPDKYKRWLTVFWQISIFSIILYIFILPTYIYVFSIDNRLNYMIYVFALHILLNIFWSTMITEILSSYRYVLLWVYGSFIWFIATIFLSVLFFVKFSVWDTSLYILVWIIIVINFVTHFLRSLFEFLYYTLYSTTWTDNLWDIFYKIESEETEIIKKTKEEMEKI